MSKLIAKGNWNIAKGKIKQKIARVTRDHSQFLSGKKDEWIGQIQKQKGKARKQIERAAEVFDECRSGHR